jgi:two-component sensor histidine kinase/HAMP domain-containing protein
MISLLPLAIVGYGTYDFTEKAMKQEVVDSLTVIIDRTINHLNYYISEKKRDVKALSQNPSFIDALEKYNMAFKSGIDSQEYSVTDNRFRPFLTQYLGYGYYDLFLISRAGDVVFTVINEDDFGTNLKTGPYQTTELAKVFDRANSLLETHISEFKHYSPSNEPAAFIAAPVLKEGGLIGVLAVQLDTEELYKQVQYYTGLGESGEVVLASREGDKVVFVAPLRHDPDAAFKKKVTIGSGEALPIQKAINREEGYGISIDYRKKEILAVWKYFDYLELGIVVKQDVEEAFGPVNNLKNWSLTIGFIIMLGVISAALLIARSISKPIRQLQKGAEIIGRGDLGYKIGTGAGDEIGQLSRAFDRMTEDLKKVTASRDELNNEIMERRKAEKSLQKARDELELRVQERTTDLENVNKLLTEEISFRKQAKKKIEESLKEKEILLKEIHHRVKNNMQVISSLIELQTGCFDDKYSPEMFNASKNRIKAMSLIHEKLYKSKDIARIYFADYVEDLANGLFTVYSINPGRIALDIDVEDITFDVDTAIPCGLIINELISNSLKYAFPEGREGKIKLTIKKIQAEVNGDNEYELIVGDNGVGIPESLNFRETKSLGLQLVTTLAGHQLRGKVELNRADGTEFHICFKELKYKARVQN